MILHRCHKQIRKRALMTFCSKTGPILAWKRSPRPMQCMIGHASFWAENACVPQTVPWRGDDMGWPLKKTRNPFIPSPNLRKDTKNTLLAPFLGKILMTKSPILQNFGPERQVCRYVPSKALIYRDMNDKQKSITVANRMIQGILECQSLLRNTLWVCLCECIGKYVCKKRSAVHTASPIVLHFS